MSELDSQPVQSLLTIGELVVDWIATTKGASWSGPDTFLRSAGGNAANVATAYARLGGKTRLVAKVGSDIHGRYLLETLSDSGIDTRFVFETSRYPTAQCYVLTSEDEENIFFNWPKPNACHQLTVKELSPDMFEGSFALHATGISLTVEPRSHFVIAAMRRARELGLLISFDAGFPYGEGELARKLTKEAMSLSHLLKVNLPELIYWLGRSKHEVAVSELAANPTTEKHLEILLTYSRDFLNQTGAEVVLCTLGAFGSIVVNAENEKFYPPYKVKSLAGVGAGDAYVAAILYKLYDNYQKLLAMPGGPPRQAVLLPAKMQQELEQNRQNSGKMPGVNFIRPQDILALDWDEAARFANATGALATRTISASSGLPTLAEVEALLS
ncbi:MAG: carbohydrate kinase family protein [Candidatus Obscuribacter phosphatis]|uniref:Carbohydrate kinase family protein n=1 Tax=Candidatus Obscuribacter phosphatis TaxID=1906157 RepID=A0A8J7TM50_9BACT|nr:carbohydrate kinase family protein [Candidatus Obscuribacter phosphatis]